MNILLRAALGSIVMLMLGASHALAGSDADVLKEQGMLGEWAADCKLPPFLTNPHVTFAAPEGRDPSYTMNKGGQPVTNTLRDVRSVGGERIRLVVDSGVATFDIVIEKKDGQFRSVESVGNDGKIYISNGYSLNLYRGEQWYEKCSASPVVDTSLQAVLTDAFQDCFQSEDRNRAIAGCTVLIRLQPAHPAGHNNRGASHGENGNFDSALADLDEAIRIDPLYASARNNRAWAYFKAGKAAQGLPDANRALELHPTDTASLDTRARIYEAMGRRDEAIADFRRLLSLLPSRHPKFQETQDALQRLGKTY